MANELTTQAAIQSIQEVLKDSQRYIPNAKPTQQTTLQLACEVLELGLKFRINKEDILSLGEIVARISRSIVQSGVPDEKTSYLGSLNTCFANIHAYLEDTWETTQGWDILMNEKQRLAKASSIANKVARFQEDLRRAAGFLNLNLEVHIVGSVDDLMEDMQAMMDKLRRMDHYIQVARKDGTLNRQVDCLVEMAIQLQHGLDFYHHNVSLRNVQSNQGFEASIRESFDKVVDAAKDTWHAQKTKREMPLHEMMEEWMLASEDVEFDPTKKSTFLGKGASATVHLGQYQGREVAVKLFDAVQIANSAELERMIRKEIKAWRDVSNEMYVLTLIGVCTKTTSPILVCEYCPYTITRYVYMHPEKLVEMVYQFACGLVTLHDAGIIHRDLKGGNVLVTSQGTVAIADFGLSRSTESLLTQYTNAKKYVGTLNWMSPEQRFSPRKVTVQSDIWSFGMTVWELLCDEIPFREYCQEEIEEAIRGEDERPDRPEDLAVENERLWDLITWCWKVNPFQRPKAREIITFLVKHYAEVLDHLIERNTSHAGEANTTVNNLQFSDRNNGEYNGHYFVNWMEGPLGLTISRGKLDGDPPIVKRVIGTGGSPGIEIVEAGDLLLSVNGEITANLSFDSVLHMMASQPKPILLEFKKSVTPLQSPKSMTGTWTLSKRLRQRDATNEVETHSQVRETEAIASEEFDLPLGLMAEWRVDIGQITQLDRLGSGGHAEVWKGKYRNRHVAIKSVRQNKSTRTLVNEFSIMTRIKSPYIIDLVGVSWTTSSDVKIIMEFMNQGDLRTYLQEHDQISYSWRDKIWHMLSIARGLAYLHDVNIVHCDVKSRNVLLDSSDQIKLTDFGVAHENDKIAATGLGTSRWMAPEIILGNDYSEQVDIYSFGVLLSEMNTHQIPYHDAVNPATGQPLVDMAILSRVANGSLKPEFSPDCPTWVLEMAMDCLSSTPHNRPSAYQLTNIIRRNLDDTSVKTLKFEESARANRTEVKATIKPTSTKKPNLWSKMVKAVGAALAPKEKSTSDEWLDETVYQPRLSRVSANTTTTGDSRRGSLSLLNDPELLAVRINAAEVEEIQMISRGGFVEVWSGMYQNRPVAIRRLLPDKKTFDDAMTFAAEIKVMARLNHPKIVEFIGASWSNALSIQSISEYMNCGDLKSLLERSMKSGTDLPWLSVKLNLAVDITDALVYLHTLNPKYIHRDVKSRNILIDADNGA
ncbi:unnamed protein product, partial [Aphanomyces euteiches]